MGSLVHSVGGLLGDTPNGADFVAQGVSPQQLNSALNTSGDAIQQQNALAQALAAQGQQGMGSQLQLGQALQQQSQGLGPNPASAMLANTTGQNIAAQGALLAGQRGASGNIGMLSRQAGQQGANIQQQALGQNAVLQAQQQLAAQNQLQNLAATQIGQQGAAVGGLNQYALQNQGQLLGMQQNQNATNQAMSAVNANNTAKTVGGLLNGASAALSSGGSGGAASAGKMFAFADGGEVPDHMQALHGIYYGGHYEHKQTPKLDMVNKSDRFQSGGMVPGKPKVDENSPMNDTVNAKLSPHEIVLPLSVTQSDDPAAEAAKFVAALLKKRGSESKSEESEFKLALKDAIKSRKK